MADTRTATCETHGHLFGHDGLCIMCKAPKTPNPVPSPTVQRVRTIVRDGKIVSETFITEEYEYIKFDGGIFELNSKPMTETPNPAPVPTEFYIVDVRPEWRKQRYITLWRKDNAGYCWSVPWAGVYSLATVSKNGGYYANKDGRARYARFPVPREAVERLATEQPRQGDIDGNVGPILLNDEATRRALRAARYIPVREAVQ